MRKVTRVCYRLFGSLLLHELRFQRFELNLIIRAGRILRVAGLGYWSCHTPVSADGEAFGQADFLKSSTL
jgi:hypothetical protein